MRPFLLASSPKKQGKWSLTGAGAVGKIAWLVVTADDVRENQRKTRRARASRVGPETCY